MEDIIVMSQKELNRLTVVGLVINGNMSLVEGAEKMGVSYRQAQRVKGAVLKEGPPGVIHGNRGKESWNKCGEAKRALVTELAMIKYAVCNDTHCWEKINGEEKIKIGREKIRQWRRAKGMPPKRKRRPPRHHSRRERRDQFGAMALWDGSPHRWFGSDQPPCCFMGAVDDATGDLLSGYFIEAESSLGYLVLLDKMIRRYGIPLCIYHDKHGALVRNDENWSLEEQMRGKQDSTQVGAVLESLGIVAIPANSPQAKGRIERVFGTLQDRLIAEMQLAGIGDKDTANVWLEEVFIPYYNRRFGIKPKKRENVFRSAKGLDLKKLISFSYEATVGNDNAVRLGGLIIDIPPGPGGRSYAKCKVQVRQLLDGAWRVYYCDALIANHSKTEAVEPVRARIKRKNHARATREYAWIYIASKNRNGAGKGYAGTWTT